MPDQRIVYAAEKLDVYSQGRTLDIGAEWFVQFYCDRVPILFFPN